MHIPDNYLSPETCTVLVAAMAPIWAISLKKVRVQVQKKEATVPLIGVGAALAFLIMMFNVPIPGGTTAHAIGAAIVAILIGPWAACLSISIALIIQAFIFGDGGILAYGANAFNMAFIMPFISYGVFILLKKYRHAKIGAFLSGYIGINMAALMASIELGLQPLIAKTNSGKPLYNPYPLSISIPAMTISHLLLIGWIEAFLTLAIYTYISKHAPDELYSETKADGKLSKAWLPMLIVLAFLSPIGLLASGTAWGEWGKAELLVRLNQDHLGSVIPKGIVKGFNFKAWLVDYGINGLAAPVGYIFSAFTALLLIVLIVKIWGVYHANHS